MTTNSIQNTEEREEFTVKVNLVWVMFALSLAAYLSLPPSQAILEAYYQEPFAAWFVLTAIKSVFAGATVAAGISVVAGIGLLLDGIASLFNKYL